MLGDKGIARLKEAERYIRTEIYDPALKEVNETLVALGKDPITPRPERYMHHMVELNNYVRLLGFDFGKDFRKDVVSTFGELSAQKSKFLDFAEQRLANKKPAMHAVQSAFDYLLSANVFTKTTIPANRMINTMNHEAYADKPILARVLREGSRNIMGVSNPGDDAVWVSEFFRSPMGQFVRTVQQNQIGNAIIGNLSVILSQAGSFPAMFAATSARDVLIAAYKLYTPSTRKAAMNLLKSSFAFNTRKLGIHDIIPGPEGLKNEQILMRKALDVVDKEVSKLAFLAGFENAMRKGFTKDKAIMVGDSIASAVNRIYHEGETPRLLRSKLFSTVFPIQGYSFQAFNFAVGALKGATDKEKSEIITHPSFIPMVFNFAIGSAMIGALYKYMFGIRSPISEGDYIPIITDGRYNANSGNWPFTESLLTKGELPPSKFGIQTPMLLQIPQQFYTGLSQISMGDDEKGIQNLVSASLMAFPKASGSQIARLLFKQGLAQALPKKWEIKEK